ncbi:glycosyltransferase family 32 protein [Treponema pedis]|uniref:glycosyltransferase family 32 protein n=1 Tax=Treponema pedis TaxID=409322 RepID=UPI003D1A2C25
MIPKIIHYCWFGGNQLPPLAEKCIASWKKFCPDYEIKEWNELNYNVHKIPYISQAYEAKKYAFVSDYARFDILYEYGGIYFDTDVEVIKPIDELIEKGPFAGIERPWSLNAGLGFASRQREAVLKEILESYKKSDFIKSDGSLDLTTVVTRVSDIFRNYGFTNENKIQTIAGITIYPTDYFCPKNYGTGKITVTDNTYTIHHYDGSWCSKHTHRLTREKEWILKNIGNPYLAWFLRKLCIAKFRFLEFIHTK